MRNSCRSKRRWRRDGLPGAILLIAGLALETPGARAADAPPGFFDPVVTISPGINREVNGLFDHVRDAGTTLTQASARLQYPLTSWMQLSVEMPVTFLDPESGSGRTNAGDLIVGGQVNLWTARVWPAQVDAGIEVTLPTGSPEVLAGSTAVRSFVAAGTKLGPLDLIGNISYFWGIDGRVADTQLFQPSVAAAYPLRWIAPFAELVVLKPVRGDGDGRPQVTVLPGIEVFLPGQLSLSVGVQLPLGSARAFDQRVLAFFKWPF